MTARPIKNLPASVRQRLLDLARSKGEAYATGRGADLWGAFLRRSSLEKGAPEFREIVSFIQRFLEPVAVGLRSGQPFDAAWAPGGPWRRDGLRARRAGQLVKP